MHECTLRKLEHLLVLAIEKKSLTLFRNNFATFYLIHNKNLAYSWTGGKGGKEGKTFP